MLLTVDYREVKGNAVRGHLDTKKVNFLMRVRVDETNIVEAIEKLDSAKAVVSFEFVGDHNFLKTIQFGKKPVIIHRKVETLDVNLDFVLTDIDPRVRVNLILPKDYSDMRSVYEYSQKHPNIRISGGKLLRLHGCSIGAIGQEDIPKKIANSRIKLIVDSEYCIIQNAPKDEVEGLEYYEDTKAERKPRERTSKPKTKTQAKPRPKSRPKKQLSSLTELVSTSALDNF